MLMSLLILACRQPGTPPSGTFVGNPGEATSRLAAYGESITLSEAEATIGFTDAAGCSSDLAGETPDVASLDLLGENSVQLPPGEWCALGVYVESVLLIGGFADEAEFEIRLEPGLVELYTQAGLTVDGDDFILELADTGWLSDEVIRGLDWDDERVLVTEEDPLSTQLSEAIVDRSALFLDDGDGLLSDAERDLGAVVAGIDREEDVSGDTGRTDGADTSEDRGGCGGAVSVALLLPLGLGIRRRPAGRG